MKDSTASTWILAAFALAVFASFVLPLEAEAQFPKPKPAASAPAVLAPPAPTPPAPPPPVVTTPEPDVYPPLPPQGWTQFDVIMWLFALLMSTATGTYVKNSFWPAKPPGAPIAPATVTDLLKTIDAKVRPQIDQLLLQIVTDALKRGGTP